MTKRHRRKDEAISQNDAVIREDLAALERAVTGAIRSAIHDHGPINVTQIGSAVKRVVGNLRNARGIDRIAAAAMGRKRWASVSAEEHSRLAARAGRRGGRAAWGKLSAAQRSAEMKRRAAKRKRRSKPPAEGGVDSRPRGEEEVEK